MRGRKEKQGGMFVYITAEKMAPIDHPIREIKRRADAALKRLSPLFDKMYSDEGKEANAPKTGVETREAEDVGSGQRVSRRGVCRRPS